LRGRAPGTASESREITQTAVAEPTAIAGMLDDQLATRLLYQRIIVVGAEVDDKVANRLCAQLLLLSAEDPRGLAAITTAGGAHRAVSSTTARDQLGESAPPTCPLLASVGHGAR
jgi:ATP-dependent protease ClpP protease subunit